MELDNTAQDLARARLTNADQQERIVALESQLTEATKRSEATAIAAAEANARAQVLSERATKAEGG
jgi:DNA-binding protein H-NS